MKLPRILYLDMKVMAVGLVIKALKVKNGLNPR